MSNETNQIIIERIVEEVEQMSTSSILRELDGGMKPTWLCDSWDERVGLTDRDWAIEALSNKRFEEWPQGS